MGISGDSGNSLQLLSSSSSAISPVNPGAGARHGRADSDVDSSSTGSIDRPYSENSSDNNNNHKSTPSSLSRRQSLRRQNSINCNNEKVGYENCRNPPHFDLQHDPYYKDNENVKVMIRIRPLSDSEISSQGYRRCVRQDSGHSLTWLGHPQSRFSFDHVASEFVSQEEVFNIVGVPMVENCLAGYNSCMFAYGQTGSGKTHTILGDLESLDNNPSEGRGLTPRILEHLFARIEQEEYARKHENLKYSCKCSFLEIYNEQVTDLLEATSTNLLIREDHKRGIYVERLTEVDVMSVQDAIALLHKGIANRKVGVTNMNRESSRSHSILTCSIQCRNDYLKKTVYGLLHLVDLAGSERQKLSGAEGGRLKEASNINKSLSTLGLVIMNLVDIAKGKERHVPYRQSKLTFLLQDSLGGNSKTTLIANISPSSCYAVETLSTLKFAQRTKLIHKDVVRNEDATEDVTGLRTEIEQLKRQLWEIHHAQDVQKGMHYFAESTDPSCDLGSGYVYNGNQITSSSSQFCRENCTCEGSKCSINCIRKITILEGIIAGALKRELESERLSKHLSAQIKFLQCLVQQREEENQGIRMLLKFREEKISRMESAASGSISLATSLAEENKALQEEIKLIRRQIDRNPELTRFAMENIKLIEELRRYQEFYEFGERDLMIKEISYLQDKLTEMLDWKWQQEQSAGKEMLNQFQVFSNIENKSWNTWSMCSKPNPHVAKCIDEIQIQLDDLKSLCLEQQKMIDTIKNKPEELSKEQHKHVDEQFKAPSEPCDFEAC